MAAKINLRYEFHGDSTAYRQSWTEDFAFGYVFKFSFIFLMYLNMFLFFVCLKNPEEDVIPLGTGVMHGCKASCGCWALKMDPLQEHPMLLTTEPSLQPSLQYVFNIVFIKHSD